MASFYTVAQKLKAILDLISTSVIPVKFEYMETLPTSFPAAMIALDGSPAERQVDQITNELTCRFQLLLWLPPEPSQTGFEKACKALDAIGDEFRKNSHATLDGAALNLTIDSYSSTPDVNAPQPLTVLAVRVSAKMLKSTQST